MSDSLWLIPGILYATMTLILVSNVVYLRRVSRMSSHAPLPQVSVMIPARNEEANLSRLIPSLLDQRGVELEIIIFDDDSEDGTWSVVQACKDPRIRPLRANSGSLPDGWLGKTHALYQASRGAQGEIYLFLDADVVFLRPDAVERLVRTFLRMERPAAMSAVPDWSAGGGGLLVSLAANSMLLSIPWLLVNRLRLSSLGALNGQCWVIGASDYHNVEPHEAQKGEILEDVQIGRYLLRHGFDVWITAARDLISVRMYDSLGSSWLGLRKNAYLLFGGTPGLFLLTTSVALLIFLVAPLLTLVFLLWQIVLKTITDRVAGFSFGLALLAPVSYTLGWLVAWDSFFHHMLHRVHWKGREVSRASETH